jgi:DcmR-like sensory protein
VFAEHKNMGLATVAVQQAVPCAGLCRLVVRNGVSLAEVPEFVSAGLQIGQQVVAMAGPTCLKEIASSLGEAGLRPDAALRTGRLVFLTAPDCLSQLAKPDHPLQRGALRRNGPLLRWVSDWSWAYANGHFSAETLRYQRLVHAFVRSLGALSLCTAHCQKVERSALLALLADHRRATRVQSLSD